LDLHESRHYHYSHYQLPYNLIDDVVVGLPGDMRSQQTTVSMPMGQTNKRTDARPLHYAFR